MEIPLDPKYAQQLHAFRKQLLQDLASVQLTELKEGYPHEQVLPKATYAPWRSDRAFMELYKKVASHTLVDIYRLYELYVLAASVPAEEGDFLEVGVWKGGSAAILGTRSEHLPDCKLWLADTFSGVPKATSANDTIYQGGEHADTSVNEVKDVLLKCGVTNYEILRGIFPKETSGAVEGRKFRFVHIDVDSYESAAQVFRWVWPRVAVGAVVVFDDYGFWGCEGVAAFVNELRDQGVFVVHNLNGHAVVPKCMTNPCVAETFSSYQTK
jgi:O-methyltransferase